MPPAGTAAFAPGAFAPAAFAPDASPDLAFPVHAPMSAGCRICRASTSTGYSMCTSCRDVAVALRRPPVPVSTIALVDAKSALYRALRQYKSGEPGVAARQSQWLSGLLRQFAERHLHCVAPEGVDATVIVPSSRGGRPMPHPFEPVVRAARCFPELLDALEPGAGVIAHRSPARDGYRVRRAVAGRRVLLMDDVYTTGAHLQSAAAALEEAGAQRVQPLVVARIVRATTPQTDACLRCGR